MRKVICVLMCAIFITTPVIASDIDLSVYSVDELIELQHRISDTLAENGGLTIISEGAYLVGRDIAAGSYVLKPHSEDGYFEYYVYKTEEDRGKYENACNKYRKAYYDALEREEAGEEPNWPKQVNEKKFMTDQGLLNEDDKSGVQISLTEGQLLVLTTGLNDITVTIEKINGLFME